MSSEDASRSEADTVTAGLGGEPSIASTKPQSESAEEPDPPPDADDSRWKRFASTEPSAAPEPAGPARRTLRRVAAALRGESAIAALVSLLLTAAMNWKVLRDPLHAVPKDLGDPLQQTYTLAWGGFALMDNPAKLWNASNFYPNKLSFAFTDTLLGYAPASIIGTGYEAAVLRYNVLYLLTFALAFFGCYVLLRQLGARVAGSAVGAVAFAYAPWKLAQAGHLNILSVGGIALALAMLARGHGYSLRHGYRREHTRWGWVIGGWLVAAWQVSIGFAMGVAFGYLLAGIAVVALLVFIGKNIAALLEKRKGPKLPWPVVVADTTGMLAFAGASLALALPYFAVLREHPEAARPLAYVDAFSPVWSSFLISPVDSALWGDMHAAARENMNWPPEQTLLVGFTILALAAVGLLWSSWTRWQRTFLALGTAVTVALGLGTNFIDDGNWMYVLAYDHLPGFDGLRTPGRLVLYTSLLLSILAAGTLTGLADRLDRYAAEGRIDVRWRPSVPMPMRAALLLPLALVVAEGYSSAETPRVPDSPVAMAELADPVLVLPSDGSNDFAVQYWSIDGFPRIVNGTAGFTPSNQEEIREHALTFPSEKSVADLRADGVKTVVAVRDRLDGSQWDYLLDVPSRDSTITVEDRGSVLVFTL